MAKFQNLTDRRFGRLIIVERAKDYISPLGKHATRWLCECDCGNKTIVVTTSLKSGGTTSCGCYNKERTNEINFHDLTKQRFGRLIVIKRVEDNILPSGQHQTQWWCQCDCGNEIAIIAPSLVNRTSTSCGCYKIDCFTGENHPNWQGGITSLNNQIRTSTKYKEWRTQIYKRDNYTCQYSGQEGGSLQVHHKKPFHLIIEESQITTLKQALVCDELWDIENGVTLSEEFHSQTSHNPSAFHKIYGTSYFTQLDFDNWITGV